MTPLQMTLHLDLSYQTAYDYHCIEVWKPTVQRISFKTAALYGRKRDGAVRLFHRK